MNPSQTTVLEPFVTISAVKPWEVTHAFPLAPAAAWVTEDWARRDFPPNYTQG